MSEPRGRMLLGPALSILVLSAAQPARAAGPESLLARALSCRLADADLATLPAALSAADPVSFAKPSERHGAPTFDVFAIAKPVAAFGRTITQVVLQPGRVLVVVPLADKAEVERSYGLKPPGVPYSPDEHVVGEGRRLVAFTLEGASYETKLFVGCQYEKQAAARWGAEDEGLSALLR